jgi:Na+/H+-dicarboxylate symporter
MSKPSAAKRDRVAIYATLAALAVGIVIGAANNRLAPQPGAAVLEIAGFVGTLWLNALKMTVIPLVVSLLILGIARGRAAAAAGRVASRSVVWIVVICTVSAIFGAIAVTLITAAFPLARETALNLQTALAAIEQPATSELPSVFDFFKGIVPSNVFAAATNGDVLPLVIFTLLFGLALAKIQEPGRDSILALAKGVSDALLEIIRWVLLIAPIGVFALAYTVGAAAGTSAFAGLVHYLVVLSAIGVIWTALAYPLAIVAGRIAPGRFVRGTLAAQAVAISTRSSLATLPAMLTAARALGVKDRVADATLPLAVALFRATGPAMNCAVAFYIAHWLGLHPTPGHMVAAVAVAAIMSYGAVSLPGEISYISTIAPIAIALGMPVAPLALLVAVETIPDIFRTVGNVTYDVTLAAIIDRGENGSEA